MFLIGILKSYGTWMFFNIFHSCFIFTLRPFYAPKGLFFGAIFSEKKVRHIMRIWDLGIVGAPVFEARKLGEFVWLPMADIWAIYDIWYKYIIYIYMYIIIYIRRVTHMHTYLPTYIPTYIHTYLHTYLSTYIPT